MSLSRNLITQIRSASNRLLLPRSETRLTGYRFYASGNSEAHLANLLRTKFLGATDVQVVDVSGGCGSMYEVFVEAVDFRGLRMIQQHKLVTEALKEEIKEMHGLRISTAVPN